MMTRVNQAVSIVIATFFAVTVNAATFRLERENHTASGGEVCLFDAKSLDGPRERLTTFSKVECFPAEGNVPLPAGTWNVFARHPEGYVSQSLLLVRDGRVTGDQRVIKLERAGRARLEFVPLKTETVAFYVENTGVVIPVVPGEHDVLLPTESRLFPLVMEAGFVRSIGAGFALTSSTSYGVPRPPSVAGHIDFAVGVVADQEAFARIPSRERAAGEIQLSSAGGNVLPAANRLDLVFKGGEGLALFRSVPALAGGGIVRVVGDGWSSVGGRLSSFATEGPLRVSPTTTLTVRWSVIDDVVRLAEQFSLNRACPGAESPAAAQARDIPGVSEAGLTLTLAECRGLHVGTSSRSVRKASCNRISSALLDENKMSGIEVMTNVSPGVYLLRLSYEALPPAFEIIEVADGDESTAIELRYDRWFGKVTRGREPLHAQISIGEGAVTDPSTGEYFSVSIPVPPLPANVASRFFTDPPLISIVGCDSEIKTLYAPDEHPIPNTRFDIEIEPNLVKVKVIDAGDSTPLAGATVELAVVRRDRPDSFQFGGEAGKADETGSFEISDLPPAREVEVCASHDDYNRRCADRFTLKKEREKSLTIALHRADVRTGRVFHPGVGGGRMIWYSVDGRSLESVPIASDGTFNYKQQHAPGEVVSVVSAGAPLLVLRQPQLTDDEPFNIRYPSSPVRNFNVSLSGEAKESKGFVSLSIGDIVVPLSVLSDHLRPRGVRPLFLAPGEIVIRDVVASGAVSFIFAPISWAENYARDISVDFFYLPAAGALPRVAAGSHSNVTVGN